MWLIIRVYLGYLWLVAGLEKLVDPSGLWVGSKAGAAVAGFARGAMQQSVGEHPQVSGWYASFLENVVVPNAAAFSYLVTFGEILVGVALILGLFTGIAAFFGGFMNASYIFAGVAGANPLMFILASGGLLGSRPVGSSPSRRPRLTRIHVPRAPLRPELRDQAGIQIDEVGNGGARHVPHRADTAEDRRALGGMAEA